MNALIIKDPADLLSFIGHTLGFWPQESLVCITLDKGKVGATLRIDLPRHPGTELPYARTVSSYLTSDTSATSIVFALYTSAHCEPGQPKPHAATIAALTGALAENGITIRDGIFVSDETYSPYDSEPGQDISLPISTAEYSRVNAEFIYRGSTIEPTNQIVLPTPTQEAEHATAVENRMNTIRAQTPRQAALQASQLWTGILDSNDFPTDEDCATLIAYFQFPHIRDRLMADIPGIDEPPQHILFAQTETAPKWSRIEWTHQLLLHAYTRTSPQHATAILTTISHINWWEGRGSKAHRYLQLALDTDLGYRFARLTHHRLGAGIIAGWNTTKTPCTKPAKTCPSETNVGVGYAVALSEVTLRGVLGVWWLNTCGSKMMGYSSNEYVLSKIVSSPNR